jgi:hypothetical protein
LWSNGKRTDFFCHLLCVAKLRCANYENYLSCGTSTHFLPGEKKFFLAHWFETMNGTGNSKANHETRD